MGSEEREPGCDKVKKPIYGGGFWSWMTLYRSSWNTYFMAENTWAYEWEDDEDVCLQLKCHI